MLKGVTRARSPLLAYTVAKMSLVKQGPSKGRKAKASNGRADGVSVEPESVEESIRVCTRMRPLFPKEVR